MGRAPCCDKANVKKGPWSPEEDAKLKAYIEKYGTGGNWIVLPQKIGLKRCGKSCRLRWLNYLRPNIKHGGFSEEEDNIICSLYISIGSRWSIIAAQLPGRTDNDIKNYWNTRLKKKLLGRRKQSNPNRMPSTADNQDASSSDDSGHPPPLSNSALERLQLHMQLQRLNSPLSFYNNPALWPKMPPFQEKAMANGLQLLDENSYTYPQMKVPNDPSILENESNNPENNFYEPTIPSLHHQQDSVKIGDTLSGNVGAKENNGMMEQILYDQMYMQQVSSSNQADQMESTLGNYYKAVTNGGSFMSQENHQMLDFDCFRGILDDSESWDSSAPGLIQPQEGSVFQNYELGYNNNL